MESLVCTEFEEFEDALRSVNGRYMFTCAGNCAWGLRIAQLGPVTVLQGQDGAENVFQGASETGLFLLFVPIKNQELLTINGVGQATHSVAWFTPEAEFRMHARASMRWLALAIQQSALVDHRDPGLFAQMRLGRGSRTTIADVIALSQHAFLVGEDDARRSAFMAGRLIDSAVAVLQSMDAPTSQRGRPPVARHLVLGRVLDVIEDRLDQTITLDVLSSVAGVSHRTLHAMFVEQLGTAPHRYITSRRMHRIHAALREAGESDTVSNICTRFGVWEFGSFARAYKHRFGRLPSETLAARKAG